MYELEHISSISYALAVDLNCLAADDAKQKSAVCLLADRNIVQGEYWSSRSTPGMTFYHLAFHTAYGNFNRYVARVAPVPLGSCFRGDEGQHELTERRCGRSVVRLLPCLLLPFFPS
jgi:hypothetical protein